jgi:hypothetical protein
VVNGSVHPEVEELLCRLAARAGWFVPAGELLDWLAAQQRSDRLSWLEWQRMQWKWIWDLSARKLRRVFRHYTYPEPSSTPV